MKQTDTCHRRRLVRSLSEEPPIASPHPSEIFLLDPAAPLTGMTGCRPLPEHPEYRSIEPGEDAFGDDMAMVIGPPTDDRIKLGNQQVCCCAQVLADDLLYLSKKRYDAFPGGFDEEQSIPIQV